MPLFIFVTSQNRTIILPMFLDLGEKGRKQKQCVRRICVKKQNI